LLAAFSLEMRNRSLHDKCKLNITSRPDTLNDEALGLLERSGCKRVSLWTINSGDEGILSSTGREYTTKHVKDSVDLCRKHNIEVLVGFIFGNPYETDGTAWNTIHFAKSLKANEYWFGLNRPFPGSELYQIGSGDGCDIQGRWDEYEMRPAHPTKLLSPRTNLSPNRIFNFLKKAEALT
jgi:radical SAM superfamily enzyme YgiQ (UPF0313 family)